MQGVNIYRRTENSMVPLKRNISCYGNEIGFEINSRLTKGCKKTCFLIITLFHTYWVLTVYGRIKCTYIISMKSFKAFEISFMFTFMLSNRVSLPYKPVSNSNS